ncbi:MAG: hypothetical protein ACRD9W_10110 [Terriglobia bacterium]
MGGGLIVRNTDKLNKPRPRAGVFHWSSDAEVGVADGLVRFALGSNMPTISPRIC